MSELESAREKRPVLGFVDLHKLCLDVGRTVLEIYLAQPDTFDVQLKADQSPVTRADLAAHHGFVSGLARFTPDIPVVSEEMYTIAKTVMTNPAISQSSILRPSTPQSSIPQPGESNDSAEQQGGFVSDAPRYWLLDPIDGTKEFIKKNGEFVFMLALMEQHRPVFGAIHVPETGLTYVGSARPGSVCRISGEGSSLKTRVMPVASSLVSTSASASANASTSTSASSRQSALRSCSVPSEQQEATLTPAEHSVRVAVSRSHRNQAANDFLTLLKQRVAQVVISGPSDQVVPKEDQTQGKDSLEDRVRPFQVHERPMGSGLKFTRMLEGEVDLSFRLHPAMEWDSAAAEVLLKAQGFRVCDGRGRALEYGRFGREQQTGFMAFNPHVLCEEALLSLSAE